jgi:hypothetical protein
MKCVVSLVALAVALASSPCLAQEYAPETPRYPPQSVRWKLIVGGLVLTGVTYGTGLLFARLLPDHPGVSKLEIPIAGPWLAIPENKCIEVGSTDCTPELTGRAFAYGIAGLAQLGGLALVTEALVMKTRAPQPKVETAFVMPTPIVSPTMVGFGFTGRF